MQPGFDSGTKSHNGYWAFMSNPGAFCEAATYSQRKQASHCDGHLSFAALADRHLRGKRVLLYGNSVMAQTHFAMMCDLRRENVPTKEGMRWPSKRVVYFDLPWNRGVTFPKYSLNITYISVYQWLRMGYCREREQYHNDVSKLWPNRSLYRGRFCRPFWEAVANDFDVVIANIGGLDYAPHERRLLDEDLNATLSMLGRVAASNASKRIVLADNVQTHFVGQTQSGLYEDRDQNVSSGGKGCYCAPAKRGINNSVDWRTNLMRKHLASADAGIMGAVVPLSMHRLTHGLWHMHVARTRSEHVAKPAGEEGPTRRLAAVCDCTHYCYAPPFWSGAVWPSLDGVLSSFRTGLSRQRSADESV